MHKNFFYRQPKQTFFVLGIYYKIVVVEVINIRKTNDQVLINVV